MGPGALVPIASLLGLGKLLEVAGSLWDDVLFQLHHHAAQSRAGAIPAQAEVKIDQRILLQMTPSASSVDPMLPLLMQILCSRLREKEAEWSYRIRRPQRRLEVHSRAGHLGNVLRL